MKKRKHIKRFVESGSLLEIEITSETVNSVHPCLNTFDGCFIGSIDKGYLWFVTADLPVRLVQDFP